MDTGSTSISLEGNAAILAMAIMICLFLFILITPGLIIAGLVRRRADKVLQQRAGTVIAQYDPPLSLSPAEIGFLYDMRCDLKEIRATLFHLERRKLINIDEHGAVALTATISFETLEPYEQIAIHMHNQESLAQGTPRFFEFYTIDDTGKRKQYSWQLPPKRSRSAFTAAVQTSLAKKGVKTRKYWAGFWSRTILLSLLICLWPLVAMIVFALVSGSVFGVWSPLDFGIVGMLTIFSGFLFFPAYVLLSAILVSLWTKITGRSWMNTKQVRQLWPDLEGYRLFLKTVELDNIQFEATAPEISHAATEALPYLMVFNLDTKWQQSLKRYRGLPL